jgi:hypothetical protein
LAPLVCDVCDLDAIIRKPLDLGPGLCLVFSQDEKIVALGTVLIFFGLAKIVSFAGKDLAPTSACPVDV